MSITVGSGKFVYEEVKGWGKLPKGCDIYEVADVAVDSRDRLFVFTRGKHPVIVLDREGNYIETWGQGQFVRPHSIFIDSEDMIYCVDDKGHAVHKCTPEGQLLMTIETTGHPSNTGYILNREDTVLVSGPPFNRPTGLATNHDGGFYVSDGYGNARIHRFTSEGQFLFSWGEPGNGPGQFRIPHDVCFDKNGLVYVADRLNHRIQIFNEQGEFITQWSGLHWPNALCIDSEEVIYVVEMGGVFFDWPILRLNTPPARVTIRNSAGEILAVLGEMDPLRSGLWFSPHGIAVDSRGDLYVGEVSKTHTKGIAPSSWSVLRKYIRI